jgi:hypothetical protein
MATHETIWTRCGYCSTEFGQPNDPGRKRQYCSDACKQAAYRFRKRRAEQARRAQQEQQEQARRAREEAGRQRDRARAHRPPPHAGTSRPGTWCAGCGGLRGPHTDHHDDPAHQRARRRYDALLRKAASTTFPAEADACRLKAEQLRAKYGL